MESFIISKLCCVFLEQLIANLYLYDFLTLKVEEFLLRLTDCYPTLKIQNTILDHFGHSISINHL